MKLTFMDKLDAHLMKLHLMNPLTQFNRYLHRHNIEHTHPTSELIIRKELPKKEEKS